MKESEVSGEELSRRVTEAWEAMLKSKQLQNYLEMEPKELAALMEQVESGVQPSEGQEGIFAYLTAVIRLRGDFW